MCLEFRAAGWRVEDKASGMLAPPPLQNFMFAGFSSLCDCTPTQLQAFSPPKEREGESLMRNVTDSCRSTAIQV